MTPITIEIPRGVDARVIYNSLYADCLPPHLLQDVVLIELLNDTFIDVGWYPEGDPNGAYRINVYRGSWENQLLLEPIRTKVPFRVAVEIRKLAAQYGMPPARRISLLGNEPAQGVELVSASGEVHVDKVSMEFGQHA